MLVLISILLTIIPAVAIIYPIVRRSPNNSMFEDSRERSEDFSRRLDAAYTGIKNVEFDYEIGNIDEHDYMWLKDRYLSDVALAMESVDTEDSTRLEKNRGSDMGTFESSR